MAFWCQLAPCHAIVVKWGCNNCNNMFLTQFEPLLRCSFYLRGAGGGICDSACLNLPLQLGLFILPKMPVANQVPLRALLQLASPRCALQLLWKHKDRPPKRSLSTRRAAGLQICLPAALSAVRCLRLEEGAGAPVQRVREEGGGSAPSLPL